jgi:hypothetical protein
MLFFVLLGIKICGRIMMIIKFVYSFKFLHFVSYIRDFFKFFNLTPFLYWKDFRGVLSFHGSEIIFVFIFKKFKIIISKNYLIKFVK